MKLDPPSMKFYLVMQTPKRNGYATGVVFIAAKSGADAIRKAKEEHSEYIADSEHFNKPTATQVLKVTGRAFDFTVAPNSVFTF